jgi:hypothetical protein
MRESLTGFDYTNKDYESLKQDMISGLQEKIPEYTDTSETDAGIVIIELLAKGLDILSYNQDVQANENFLVTAERRENILGRCYELAYEPEEATPSYFYQVFVLNNVLTEDFIIPKGTVVKTTETATEESVYFELSRRGAGARGNTSHREVAHRQGGVRSDHDCLRRDAAPCPGSSGPAEGGGRNRG